jgi:RNA polymerase sigma-70 factor (ECF subfamily)
MKLDEVAKELDLTLSSVKNKLYRTIERQKKKFDI